MRALIALTAMAALIALTMGAAGKASACSFDTPLPTAYRQGDLLTQYARNADVVQIMRVRSHRVIGPRPGVLASEDNHEGVQVFAAFDLEIIRTLTATRNASARRGFSFRAFVADETRPALPAFIQPQRPANEFQGRAMSSFIARDQYLLDMLREKFVQLQPIEGWFETRRTCQRGSPFFLADGDVLLTLRRSNGQLYGEDFGAWRDVAGVPVEAGVSGATAPSLFRIKGLDDPVIALMEQRLREEAQYRRERLAARFRDDVFRLLFGREPKIEHDPFDCRTDTPPCAVGYYRS